HFDVSKSAASAATSFSFVAYAIVQLVFVKIAGKLNARKYLLICSPVSVALFVLVPFCTEIWQVWILFAVTGALLSGVFPVCMLIISEYLPDELIPAANKYMGLAFALSYVLDYALSALFIHVADWRLGFFFFPAVYMVTVLFVCRMIRICPRQQREKAEDEPQAAIDKKAVFRYLLITGAVAFFVNILYYAVSNWVPNLLSEQFGLTPALSVFITLFVPLTGAAGAAVCLELCRRFPFWRVMLVLTAFSAALCLVLTGVYRIALIITLALVIVLLFVLRGIAHVFGWQVPINAKRIMNPTSAATVLNIFGCIGAAIGPPLFGALADNGSYTLFFIVSAIISFILAALALAGSRAIK
ncbi:MAG: MFS transporter, partial [Clostridia bacterium]|nr:MFS transporter [Clostridia bacterium]